MPCDPVHAIVPRIGLPHPDMQTQRIWGWCLPLKSKDETVDLVVIVLSVQVEIKTQAHISLEKSLGDELHADDAVTGSVRAEALRF